MIDIHCHILPGVDDGPVDLAGALAMARVAVADGIETVFATPHIYPEGLQRAEVEAEVTSLQNAVTEAGLALSLLPGGDCSSSLEYDDLRVHLLHEGPYLLVEFPHTHLPSNAPDLIFELTAAGKMPIVTHPERNPDIIRNPKLMAALLDAGGLVQLTAESLTGGFGAEIRACSRYLLRQGWAHFLATDAHSSSWRPPRLSEGLKVATKLVGAAQARALVLDNPSCLISGAAL